MKEFKPYRISNRTNKLSRLIGLSLLGLIGLLALTGVIHPPTTEASTLEYSESTMYYLETLHEQAEGHRQAILDIQREYQRVLTEDSLVSNHHLYRSNIYLTSYNPEVGQTDSTPCIAGGTGYNLCDMATEGQRTIALSQEMLAWSIVAAEDSLEAGTVLKMVSKDEATKDDPRCNGEIILADAMNIRYRNRGDLFMMSRAENVSCTVDLYLTNG